MRFLLNPKKSFLAHENQWCVLHVPDDVVSPNFIIADHLSEEEADWIIECFYRLANQVDERGK